MRFNEDPTRTYYTHPTDDSFTLEVTLTSEGIVIDAYAHGFHQGTTTMTAGELFDSLLPKCVHCHQDIMWTERDGLDVLVDPTDGDICGAHGSNHPHCRAYDPYPVLESVVCNGCHLGAEEHEDNRLP